jgi:hypothetical protein
MLEYNFEVEQNACHSTMHEKWLSHEMREKMLQQRKVCRREEKSQTRRGGL